MFGHLPIVFDSTSVARPERFGFAREEYGRKALNVDLDAPRKEPYRLLIRARTFGWVRVAVIDSSPYRVSRTRYLIDDGDERIGLVFPIAGHFAGEQAGREISVTRGGATTMLADRTGWFGTASGGTFLTIRAAPALVNAHTAQTGPVRAGVAVKPSRLSFDLLRGYLGSICRAADAMSPQLLEMAGRHLTELAAHALCVPDGPPATRPDGEGLRAARAALARRHMEQNFTDPGYGVRACAAHLGISVRYLQVMLEEQGTNFSEDLRGIRLQAARQRLVDKANAGLRISDIAFDCGFSDLSHFNRQFRAFFGESPRSARAGG